MPISSEMENTTGGWKRRKFGFPVLKWGVILRAASSKISKDVLLRKIIASAYFLFNT